MNTKNPLLAAGLGFFFGPFGLLYVSFKGAAKALAYVFFLTLISSGLLGLPTWLGCGAYAWYLAEESNKKRRPSEERFESARESLIEEGWEPDADDQEESASAPGEPEDNEGPVEQPSCTCGALLRPNSRFCGACGAATSTSALGGATQ